MATAWVVPVSSRSAKVAPSDTASCVSRVAGVSIRGKKTSLSAPSFSVYQALLAPARAVPKPSLSPGDQVAASPGAPGACEPVAAATGGGAEGRDADQARAHGEPGGGSAEACGDGTGEVVHVSRSLLVRAWPAYSARCADERPSKREECASGGKQARRPR